ncbi:ATP-binding protein [Flavobacterium pectinovorum]|uniref:tetratricopeptide repeat-containing sensor histidine kinase n=1 Tax=Flavobacterium pectinovorum TaxID=29533 RepID=UPI00266032F6|nr:tetratricopeptide repeat-containing sensor histidine kinase [Flavobacterium pectinovorum]WKL50398.1 ATP-binding protein [Flavobacterium pectinovorum]
MKKLYIFFQRKRVLKNLLAILTLFLIVIGVFYLLKPVKNEKLTNRKTNKKEIRKILAKADFFFENYKEDISYYYYNKAQLLCDTKVDYIDYVYAITCMASIESGQGDFITSELLLTKTLPYLKIIKKPRFAANVYEQFADNYYYTYDYSNALFYQRKALHLKTSTYRKIVVLNSMCLNFIKQKKYKLSEKILLSLLRIKPEYTEIKELNETEYARILDNLGICYIEQGKPESLQCFQKSLAINLEFKNYNALTYNYKHLSEYYQKTDPVIAKYYGQKAYDLAKQLKNTKNKIQSLDLIIRSSEGNDLKKYTQLFISLVDSANEAKLKAKNQFARIKYDSKQDRFENLQLKDQKAKNELQLERQKKRNLVSYIIILCTTGLSLLLYFYLTLKGRKEKNNEILKSEMRISKKLHDELANDVYETLSFAQRKDLEHLENKEHFINNLDILYSKTRKISKENSSIATNEFYQIALKEMISEFQTTDVNILLNGLDSVFWNQIDKNKKITLYRVLQELFLNMKKHSNATLVSTIFKVTKNNLSVIYTDNGVGISDNALIFKNGLQNVESRIKTINGTITFDNNSKKGFKLNFSFPL